MAKTLKNKNLFKKDFIVSFLSDYGFKAIFADKNNTLFAQAVIQSILNDDRAIDKLTLLRNEFEGVTKDARTGIYDVLCQDEHLRIFIVEMQVDNYEYIMERLQFYTFQLYTVNAQKGKAGFKDIPPIFCICIIEGKITSGDYYHKRIQLKDENNEVVMDNVEFHLIELGKFPYKKWEFNKITSLKDQVFYTMKYAHKINRAQSVETPEFFEKKPIKIALDKLDTTKMSPMQVAMLNNQIARENVYKYKKKQEAKAKRDEKKKIEDERNAIESERNAIKIEKLKIENELKQTENELKQTENELKQTENELKQTENELKQLKEMRCFKLKTLFKIMLLNVSNLVF
jgi:predicted transposase/invertase (TIGR01784 family)